MSDVKYPMPAGVEAMTKEQLWEWFARYQHAITERANIDRHMFALTTALHPSYYKMRNEPWNIIDAQARRIQGLETQMAQMQVGYKKKFDKLKRQYEEKGDSNE